MPKGVFVNNPIELSAGNASKTNVEITIQFRVSNAISNGVLEITFPTNFDPTGATSSTNTITVSGQKI